VSKAELDQNAFRIKRVINTANTNSALAAKSGNTCAINGVKFTANKTVDTMPKIIATINNARHGSPL
jgi:hypothetical protein